MYMRLIADACVSTATGENSKHMHIDRAHRKGYRKISVSYINETALEKHDCVKYLRFTISCDVHVSAKFY